MHLSTKLFGFSIDLTIERIEAHHFRIFTLFPTEEVLTPMNILLSSPTKEKILAVIPVNKDGNPTPIFGSIEYSVSTTVPAVVALFPNDNGSSVQVSAVNPGTTTVVVKATTKSGKEITTSFDVTVAPAVVIVPPPPPPPPDDPEEAVSFLITEGPEAEQ